MNELKKLEQLFSMGKINRREFLARTTALGLTAAVSPLLLSNQSWAAAPKRGGTLRFGCVGGHVGDSLDPAQPLDIMMYYLGYGILRNGLTVVDHTADVVPDLAESWEASSDAKQWVFKLRKGVEFHNGKSLEAEDVIFSFNMHLKEGSKSAGKGLISAVKDIRADGKYNVIFDLSAGVADFAFIMNSFFFQIVPAGTKGNEFSKGIGTGPFMLKEFEPGVKAVGIRNPNYFHEGKPYFDEVELINIVDPNARTTALMTGKVDVIEDPDNKTYQRLKNLPGIKGLEFTTAKRYVIEMGVDIKPYDNLDVRLGLKYALDREHIVKQILQGYGKVANDQPIPPTMKYFNSELPQRKYDPDKARYHIKKAGLLGHTFEIHTSDQALPGPNMPLLYSQHAKAAGINIKVVKHPSDGFWSDVWGKKGWVQSYWNGRPTPDIIFTYQYAPESHWNATRWSNDRFQKLLKEARSELDENKRRDMYWEMQQLVHELDGSVIYAFPSKLAAHNDKLGYGKLASTVGVDGYKLFERWWWKS